MTTDYRALISEMAVELDHYRIGKEGYDTSHPLAAEARAALAEPVPAADEEVAELVAWLRRHADIQEAAGTHWAQQFTRAADLLSRLAPQPVPEEPTDAELDELWDEEACYGALYPEARSFARAVLARWGCAPTAPTAATAAPSTPGA